MRYQIRFSVGVVATVSVILFGMFCYTVRAFPEGGLCIEGPWNIRVETQLGAREGVSLCRD